ncbi:hypothetical protein [Pseudomonas sp. GM25]|uniref:hypothetical protein n=1 Tax=Pseudomonas sp. GM25 TaxID=1144327 RepID=UPI00026FF3EB|nr:hypothetical protein [Pseudomonas sp. GM25]EJM28354.1 hypothetical protein PMI24_02544 [Pseudomonas sp. GM25]
MNFFQTGSMTLRVWQCLVAFLCAVGLLTILVGFTLLLRMESSTKPKLFAHPNALWVGAEDGGVFVEVTRSEAPDYYVEIRHESGGMWTEGWVRYGTRDSYPLSAAAVGGYDGVELYLYTGVAITPQKQGIAQR